MTDHEPDAASASGGNPQSDRTIDLRRAEAEAEIGLDLGEALRAVAVELHILGGAALRGGDFQETARLVEASHAVHRALASLHADSLAPAGSAAAGGELREEDAKQAPPHAR